MNDLNPCTNGDVVRRLNDVGLASLLSGLEHSADYESDDYDPLMLEWVQKEAEPGMVSLFEDQGAIHQWKPGDEMPDGWYWVRIPGRAKLVIVEFDYEMQRNFAGKKDGRVAWGPIQEPEV